MALLAGDSVSLSVAAEGDIRLRNATGDLRIDNVDADFWGAVQLEAQGSIIPNSLAIATLGTIRGTSVDLLARTGVIGYDPEGRNANARLDVTALDELRVQSYGDVELFSSTGRMNVESIVSTTGDVTLVTEQLSIHDEDRRETADRRAQAQILAALWEELKLIDDESLTRVTKAELEAAAAEAEQSFEDGYFDFWEHLLVRDEDGKIIKTLQDSYGADFEDM